MYCWWAANSFEICSLRASGNDFSAIDRTLPVAPTEPGVGGDRVHRARRHAIGHRGVVVARRSDVVGRVGVKQRRQVLDLSSPRPHLALPAAVHRDALALAVLVD